MDGWGAREGCCGSEGARVIGECGVSLWSVRVTGRCSTLTRDGLAISRRSCALREAARLELSPFSSAADNCAPTQQPSGRSFGHSRALRRARYAGRRKGQNASSCSARELASERSPAPKRVEIISSLYQCVPIAPRCRPGRRGRRRRCGHVSGLQCTQPSAAIGESSQRPSCATRIHAPRVVHRARSLTLRLFHSAQIHTNRARERGHRNSERTPTPLAHTMITRSSLQRPSRRLFTLLLILHSALLAHAGPNTPAGRTAIKINVDVPKATGTPPPPRANTGGGRGGVLPVLFRQPNAVVPPPFLQVDVALSAMDGAGNGAAAAAGSDETVFASYYGEESEHPPAEGFVAGSVPGVSADSDASASAAVMLDEFGYPLRDASSFIEGGPSEQLAAWTELSGQCWTYASASYVYSFCPYQNVTQKSTSTTLHVVLGVWDRWIEMDNDAATTTSGTAAAAATTTDGAAPAAAATTPASDASAPASTVNAATGFMPGSLLQSFTDGTACGSGKRRSTKVLFICDPLAEDGGRISDVKEPATCEYTIRFHTALVCDRSTIAAARTGHNAAASPASSASGSAAEHTVLQSMQSCITLLFQSAYPSDEQELPRHQDILARCRNFLPRDARNEAFGEEASAVPAAAAATRATAPVTPPAAAAAAAASSELSSLVSDDAAASTPAATRANIPSSIISDPDAPAASSHSNAVEPEEELNADFSLEASSSPYAELDDRYQE